MSHPSAKALLSIVIGSPRVFGGPSDRPLPCPPEPVAWDEIPEDGGHIELDSGRSGLRCVRCLIWVLMRLRGEGFRSGLTSDPSPIGNQLPLYRREDDAYRCGRR